MAVATAPGVNTEDDMSEQHKPETELLQSEKPAKRPSDFLDGFF
jgi:hypothetical protein